MNGPYRTSTHEVAKTAVASCPPHKWQVRTIWAEDDWRVVGYDRRCKCGARQPALQRLRNAILDELRRLGWYDQRHERLDGENMHEGLHMMRE